jgi:hypothetical protein
MLKITESPTLSIGCADTQIRHIVEEVNLLIAEGHFLAAEHKTIGEHFNWNIAEFEFTLEKLKDPPASLLTLITDTKQE